MCVTDQNFSSYSHSPGLPRPQASCHSPGYSPLPLLLQQPEQQQLQWRGSLPQCPSPPWSFVHHQSRQGPWVPLPGHPWALCPCLHQLGSRKNTMGTETRHMCNCCRKAKCERMRECPSIPRVLHGIFGHMLWVVANQSATEGAGSPFWATGRKCLQLQASFGQKSRSQ